MSMYLNSFRVDGRAALVIGGANGLGAAAATALAEAGASVVIADLDAAGAAALAGRLGPAAAGLAVDVADEAALAAVVEAAAARHGRLDILVYSAGTGARMPAETMPTEAWNRVLGVNLTGAFIACREAGRRMLEQRSGAIVLISSVMGLVGGGLYPNPAYQASKGALVNLARTLALDWAGRGVRVNTVAPTFAETRLTEALFADPAMRQKVLDSTPMGRLVTPAEVAAAVLFLCSDAAAMITGHTLPVDGGWVAR